MFEQRSGPHLRKHVSQQWVYLKIKSESIFKQPVFIKFLEEANYK